MKVAILTPTFYGFDGVARVAKQEAEDYHAKGNEVTIFTLEGDLKSEGINLVVMGAPKSRFWRSIYWLVFPLDLLKIKKYVTNLKNYDIVISHESPIHWLAYWGRKFYRFQKELR